MSQHEHAALLQGAHDAGAAAVEAKSLTLSLPAEAKAALRPYVHPITTAVFGLAKTGVDAALAKIPIAGAFAAGIVNPILDKLEPSVEARLTALLA